MEYCSCLLNAFAFDIFQTVSWFDAFLFIVSFFDRFFHMSLFNLILCWNMVDPFTRSVLICVNIPPIPPSFCDSIVASFTIQVSDAQTPETPEEVETWVKAFDVEDCVCVPWSFGYAIMQYVTHKSCSFSAFGCIWYFLETVFSLELTIARVWFIWASRKGMLFEFLLVCFDWIPSKSESSVPSIPWEVNGHL